MSSKIALSSIPPELWILCMTVLAVARLLFFRYKKGLAKYNGPFLASFTDLWRSFYTYASRHKPPMLELHDKYGDIVRVGPNILTFSKPEAIRDIYGAGKAWDKSSFYPVQAAVVKGQSAQTLFSSSDIPWHNALRRAINPFFTATASVAYEHSIDKTVDVLLEQWDTRFAGRKGPEGVIDLATWLLYFSFDVIGELTYGASHGFMEAGGDPHDIINHVRQFGSYGAFVGPSSLLDKCLRHNPVLLWLERHGFYQGNTIPLAPFVAKRMKERVNYYNTRDEFETKEKEDILDNFLKANKTHPKAVTEREVLSLSLTMLLAGAETTSISLTAIFYYLLKNPACYAKLQQELDTQLPARDASSLKCDVDFSLANKLPYLHACVQETFRVNPASAILLERVVPPAGADIAGERIPGGTVVGVSTLAVHHNQEIFGKDASIYRPERWLEAGEQQVRLMERSMLHFGAGNHLCLGRNISAREIYKVVPALLGTFKMELEHPEKDCTLNNTLFMRQQDVMVRIERKTK